MTENKIYKYHPLYVPLSILKSIGGLLFVYLVILFASKDSVGPIISQAIETIQTGGAKDSLTTEIILIILAQPIIFIAILAYKVLKYKNTFLYLYPTSIRSEYRGIINKKNKEVPLSHISNVNLNASILYMIFGLKEVKIDINSSETAMQDDYSIVLKKSKAEELRNLIKEYNLRLVSTSKKKYSKKNNSTVLDPDFVTNMGIVEDEIAMKSDFDYKFSLGQVIIHTMFSTNIFTIVMFISGIISSLGDRYSLLLLSILLVVKDLISGMNNFYNLRVVTDSENIHISHGITEIKSFDISRKNIISISTKQDLLARLFGYECISLDVIGVGNASGEGNLASLYMKRDKLREYAKNAGLKIEYTDNNLLCNSYDKPQLEKTPKKLHQYFKDTYNKPYIKKPYKKLYTYFFIRNIILTGLVAVFTVYFIRKNITYITAPLAVIAISAIMSYISVNKKNVYMSSKKLVMVYGILSKSTEIIPYTKIDIVEKRQNIIQKNMGLASINIYMRDHKTGKTVESTGLYDEYIFNPIIDYYTNGEK